MKYTIEEFGKMLGGNAKMAGPDSPIYKEPPTIVVTKKSKKSSKKKNSKPDVEEKIINNE